MKPTKTLLAFALLMTCVIGCKSGRTSTSTTLTVEPAVNLYRFLWSNNTEGLGIKRRKNIAVGIGGARCGFVTYEIQSDGTLDGIWGGYGSEKTGTEKATKQ